MKPSLQIRFMLQSGQTSLLKIILLARLKEKHTLFGAAHFSHTHMTFVQSDELNPRLAVQAPIPGFAALFRQMSNQVSGPGKVKTTGLN